MGWLSNIIQNTGWKSEWTFAQFCKKQIKEEVELENYLKNVFMEFLL